MTVSDHVEVATEHPWGIWGGGTIALSSSKKAILNSGEVGAYTLVTKREMLE
jgi:hypothetical protein